MGSSNLYTHEQNWNDLKPKIIECKCEQTSCISEDGIPEEQKQTLLSMFKII